MGQIHIETEGTVKESSCRTCRGTNHLLHGYAYDDGEAHGIYFLEWCDGDHPHRAAFLTVGLGEFEEDASSDKRNAFCVEWRAEGMRLADQPARDRTDLLGRFIPREVAILGPDIDELWHVVDHVVTDDPRVASVDAWLKPS